MQRRVQSVKMMLTNHCQVPVPWTWIMGSVQLQLVWVLTGVFVDTVLLVHKWVRNLSIYKLYMYMLAFSLSDLNMFKWPPPQCEEKKTKEPKKKKERRRKKKKKKKGWKKEEGKREEKEKKKKKEVKWGEIGGKASGEGDKYVPHALCFRYIYWFVYAAKWFSIPVTVYVKLSWKSIYLTPTQQPHDTSTKVPVLDMKPRFINPYKQNITMVFHIFPAVFKLCQSTQNWKLINSSHCWWFCCWLNIRKSAEDIGFRYIPYWKSAKDRHTAKELTSWTNCSTTALSWETSILPKSGRKWAPGASCLGQGHSFYGWCPADTDPNHCISTCIETSLVLVAVSVSGQCCFMLMDWESKIFGAAIFVVSWFWCSVYWYPALLALIWPVQLAGC